MPHPVPAAKDALKAILNARPAWATIEVMDGGPTEGEDYTYDAFWFEPTEIPSDAWASVGAGSRRIAFRLGFVISVLREGDNERDTEDHVWTLYEDLLAAIKANPTLNGVVLQVGDVQGRQVNGPRSKTVWQAAFIGSIGCTSNSY